MENSKTELELPSEGHDGNIVTKSIDKKFDVNTIVLAKVKGYPPWPAMILDEAILPGNIIEKKPKNVKQSAKKKKSKPIEILPVRFFSDDTYIWIKDQDLKILDAETIQKYLEKHSNSKRKDNLLLEAYILASNPPDMELFVQYGSKGKQDEKVAEEEYIEDEEEEEEEEEEEDIDDVEELEEDKEEEDFDFEQPSKKKQKKSTKVPSKKLSKKKSKTVPIKQVKIKVKTKEVDPKEEGYDSDWGFEETNYDYNQGNYIFEDEKEQEAFISGFPSISAIQEKLNKYQTQFNKINEELLVQFLNDGEIEEVEVLRNLNKLKSLSNLPKSIILKSKLLKTLILVIRKPIEEFPNEKIRTEIEGILKTWFNLTVVTNTIEELRRIDEELNNANKDSKAHSQEAEVIESTIPVKEEHFEEETRFNDLNSTSNVIQEDTSDKTKEGHVVPSGVSGSVCVIASMDTHSNGK